LLLCWGWVACCLRFFVRHHFCDTHPPPPARCPCLPACARMHARMPCTLHACTHAARVCVRRTGHTARTCNHARVQCNVQPPHTHVRMHARHTPHICTHAHTRTAHARQARGTHAHAHTCTHKNRTHGAQTMRHPARPVRPRRGLRVLPPPPWPWQGLASQVAR
jgi:hypothetical protein